MLRHASLKAFTCVSPVALMTSTCVAPLARKYMAKAKCFAVPVRRNSEAACANSLSVTRGPASFGHAETLAIVTAGVPAQL
jgi:hypothetical protein